MANTKVPSELLADNSVGITQLNVSDGTNGQVLTTNGSGTLSFSTISGYTDSDVESYLNTSLIYTDPTNDRLGIGQTSPAYKLDVYTTAAAYAAKIKNFNGTDAGGGLWIDTRWNTAGNRPLKITSNNEGTSLLEVTGTGLVGIGTSSPDEALHVYDTTESWIKTDSSTADGNSGLRFAHAGTNHGVLYHDGSTDSLSYFDNIAGSTRFTINSSGNVGIGTSSPANRLHIVDNSSNNFSTTLRLGQTYNSVYSTIGSNFGGAMTINAGQGGGTPSLNVQVNGTERVRVTTNGLTFNGDTAAANALDDYEEGTWTPSMYSLTTNYSATYTKIGRLVYIQCYIDVGSTANTSIIATMDTLPFTANSGSNLFHSLTHWSDNKAYDFMFLIQPNTAYIQWRKISNGNYANLAEISSSGYIISGFYITA